MQHLGAKIGLGALGVFLGGMVLVNTGREVKDAVAQAVHRSVTKASTPATVDLDKLHREFPFRLAGERLGTVTRLDLRRAKRGEPLSAQMVVALDQERSSRQLRHCDLVPTDDDDLGLDKGFRCSRSDEHDLAEIGSIRFDPTDLVRHLFVPQARLEDLSRGGPFQVSADLGDGVKLRGEGDEGGRFNLRADSAGASIRVDGDDGESILRLLADSTGALIRIRDRNGKEIFHLRASDRGVSISSDKSPGDQ